MGHYACVKNKYINQKMEIYILDFRRNQEIRRICRLGKSVMDAVRHAAVLQLSVAPRRLWQYEEFLSVADRDHVTKPMGVCVCVVGSRHEQHMAGLRMMMKEEIT